MAGTTAAAATRGDGGTSPTDKQLEYVEAIRKRLHLTKSLLDGHCQKRFQGDLVELDRTQVSSLLEEMTRWETIPVALLVEAGQRELPGV